MLVSGQIRTRGKKFQFRSIDHLARQWAEAGVKTIADAEDMLRTSSERYAAVKQVYRKLGKRHAISQPDEALYAKWTERWGFDMQTILAACDETSKGVPTFGYLDAILERMQKEGLKDGAALKESQLRDQQVKELLRQLGMRSTGPTDDSRSLLDGFLQSGFELETVGLAAVRVARKGGKLDALERTLAMWKEAGALMLADAEAYLRRVDGEREGPPFGGKGRGGKAVNAQQYEQRDYTRAELTALFEVI